MLKIVGEERALKRYARMFAGHFLTRPCEERSITLGHRGATSAARVFWLERIGIWFCPAWTDDSYRHLFGKIGTSHCDRVAVTCEINFPRAGVDRRMGGAFAVDNAGHVFAVHRGHLGGRRGMGKSRFMEAYRGVWADLDEGCTMDAVAVIGDLESPRFPRQVAQFVSQIALIKEGKPMAGTQQLLMPLAIDFDTDGRCGETYDDLRRDLVRECDLGCVIEDLAHMIASQGYRVRSWGTNVLYSVRGGSREETYYYVCPDNRYKSIREGTIHLFFLALRSRRPHRMYLLVPEPLPRFLTERLAEFYIKTIVYEWQVERACFPRLEI